MTEKREVKENAPHSLKGPHMDLPAGFVPLRLYAEKEGVRIEVDRPVAIAGRHTDAEVRLAFEDVSRRHCRFAFENGQWRVRDLKSLNGVFVNGESVSETALYAGDRLRIGCVLFVVEAATPVRILESSGEGNHEKLRQIMRFLLQIPALEAVG